MKGISKADFITKKRIIASVVVLALLGGGFFGIKLFRDGRTVIACTPVANLNLGFMGDPTTMEGIVYDSDTQAIYPESTQIITAVYVREGQAVKAGDPLMAYDLSSQQLTVQIKDLSIQQTQCEMEQAQAEMQRIQKVPTITQAEKEGETEPTERIYEKPAAAQKDAAGQWSHLDQTSVMGGFVSGTGSQADPYLYQVTGDGDVYNSFLKGFQQTYPDKYARLLAVDTGAAMTLYGANLDVSDYGDPEGQPYNSWWTISTSRYHSAADITPAPAGPKEGYTAAEKAQLLKDKEIEISNLDISVRRQQLEMATLQEEVANGVVTAKRDGKVTAVGDPANPPQDGSPFLKVESGGGVYIKGSVSELLMDQVQPGQQVTATSWEDENLYTGTVTGVDDYPQSGNFYYGSGNPNASYYGFTVQVEDGKGLRAGAYLQLSLDSMEMTEWTDAISIPLAYVRKDAGGSYVMKDEQGKLAKQYVTTGSTYWGEAIEIKEGLTTEDAIAFPYGDGTKEGAKTKIEEGGGIR